jgi:hypothetical protein
VTETVYVVLGDGGGAHEPLPALSIWTTEEAAKAEAKRVEALHRARYKSKHPCQVVAVALNAQSVGTHETFN